MVRAAYRDVAETWLGRARASDAMRARFEAAHEEVMFSAAVWSSNQDPLRPKVTTITRLEHEVDGRRIPGTRWGIGNPDSVYRVIPVSGHERYEIHGRVGVLDRTGSLNKAQSVANEDGTYTYVIAAQDPGVHNWIDTDGLPEGILTLRMAEFPEGGARPDLSARGRVVQLDRLDTEVPELTTVTPELRETQLAERRTAYLRRLPEVTP